MKHSRKVVRLSAYKIFSGLYLQAINNTSNVTAQALVKAWNDYLDRSNLFSPEKEKHVKDMRYAFTCRGIPVKFWPIEIKVNEAKLF